MKRTGLESVLARFQVRKSIYRCKSKKVGRSCEARARRLSFLTNAASPCSVTQGNDAQIIPHSLSSVVLGEEEERQ